MANNLQRLRLARRFTQEAAAKIGTTRNQYVKLENGDRGLSLDWIERAAKAFGIDAGEVVSDLDPAAERPLTERLAVLLGEIVDHPLFDVRLDGGARTTAIHTSALLPVALAERAAALLLELGR